MAVVIRLARHGRHKRPFYRIVVADKEMPRNGRFLEMIGTLNPLIDPPEVHLKEDRVKYWIEVGAKPSDTIAHVIEKQYPGYLKTIEESRKEKICSVRSQRKKRVGPRVRKTTSKKRGKKVPTKETQQGEETA